MANSMTGYGRAQKQVGVYQITVEIKSVNHRYFEGNVRTPRGCSFLDDKVLSFLKANIARGKTEAYISLENTAESDTSVVLNEKFTASYIDALKALQKQFKLKNDITTMSVAENDSVFSVARKSIDEDTVTEAVMQVVSEAVGNFKQMRNVEGKKLCEDCLSRLDTILEKVAFVEQRSPETVKAYRENLEARIKELIGNVQIDEQRLITETAVFADKVAVAEETVRLRSHIDQMKVLLQSDDAVGRKLDFIVQEMNREVNTTGSKAQDIDITNCVVDMKAEIEKIREQIQNIE